MIVGDNEEEDDLWLMKMKFLFINVRLLIDINKIEKLKSDGMR